jgi:prepilin-type N-terminal cleavage/methylation domain-containing protein
MKDRRENNTASGFSIIELLIAMIVMLVVMGLAMNLFSHHGARDKEKVAGLMH